MGRFKDIHIAVLIVFLMIMRALVYGKWFSCIAIAGLLVSVTDIIIKLCQKNDSIVVNKEKIRYGVFLIVWNIVLLAGLVLLEQYYFGYFVDKL